MKKLIAIAAFFCAAFLSPELKAADTINLGWEPWAPYQMMENGKLIGCDIEIFNAVAAKVGATIVPKESNWTRIMEDVKAGTVDVALAGSITPERQAFANFSDTYRMETMSLFVRKGESAKFNLNSMADFVSAKMRIGVIKDYSYGESFDNVAKTPEGAALVDPVTDVEVNIKKLNGGRIDGFLDDKAVGLYMAKKLGFQDAFEVHPVTVSESPVHFIFSKQSVPADRVAKMNAALKEFKASPEYQAIMDKYLK